MEMENSETLELSIIMPCLNEAANICYCIQEAKAFLQKRQIFGEILVVDNGSTDSSAWLAKTCGARVVKEEQRGYGAAIQAGIKNSKGKYLIIGDCDSTYDFYHLDKMFEALKTSDLVIGNRYDREMEKGAMSFSHFWGVKALSFLGRVHFKTQVRDFHCGLRGITRKAAERCLFKCDGMEFATEMIAQAAKNNMKIAQVPVELRVSRAERKSHINTISDGFRHLSYIVTN